LPQVLVVLVLPQVLVVLILPQVLVVLLVLVPAGLGRGQGQQTTTAAGGAMQCNGQQTNSSREL
jgi:hypothetical protein